jgi:hypothetical protein
MSNAARSEGRAQANVEPWLLKAAQAAEFLNYSRRHFERVKETIPYVPAGKDRRYDPEDLRKWAAERKQLGPSRPEKEPRPSKSASDTPANDTVSPREAQILQRLRQKPLASTPKLYPVGEPRSSKRARRDE